jgi:hypothetical protein
MLQLGLLANDCDKQPAREMVNGDKSISRGYILSKRRFYEIDMELKNGRKVSLFLLDRKNKDRYEGQVAHILKRVREDGNEDSCNVMGTGIGPVNFKDEKTDYKGISLKRI